MKNVKTILVASLASALLSTTAFAFQAGHPLENEIQARGTVIKDRYTYDVNHGKLTAGQIAKDQAAGANFKAEVASDEAADNGHLTATDYVKLNEQLSRGSYDLRLQATGK